MMCGGILFSLTSGEEDHVILLCAMLSCRGRKETVIGFIVGISCGIIVVRSFLSTSTASTSPDLCCSDKTTSRASSSQFKTGNRPLHVTSELQTSKKSLFIAIRTQTSNLVTRATAINTTWLRHLPPNCDATFLVPSDATENAKKHHLPIHNLPPLQTNSKHAPHMSLLSTFIYMAQKVANDYDWFLVVSDNAYVRTRRLSDWLHRLNPIGDVYLGQPGLGAPEHRTTLQLRPGEVFCMTGPGIVVSRSILKRIESVAHLCLKDPAPSQHEAVEIGRCISRRIGIQCTWAYEVSIYIFIYLYIYGGGVPSLLIVRKVVLY